MTIARVFGQLEGNSRKPKKKRGGKEKKKKKRKVPRTDNGNHKGRREMQESSQSVDALGFCADFPLGGIAGEYCVFFCRLFLW